MTYILGLTGGIGAGKSTASHRLSELGAVVLDADVAARAVFTEDASCIEAVKALFGASCVDEQGALNRSAIAAVTFSDASMRQALNDIVHPRVLARMQAQTRQAAGQKRLIVWDVPLLFESGFDAYCDATVTIQCAQSVRVSRIEARDGVGESQALARIAAQLSDAQRAERATYVLDNNGSAASFLAAVDALYQTLCEVVV